MSRTVSINDLENKVDIIDSYQDVASKNSTDNLQLRDLKGKND